MPATFTREDILRIAELARLELTADEIDLFTPQLARILDYVEQIQSLDTAGVPPTAHVINRPLDRADEPAGTLARADALANAPERAAEAGLFKVPRVFG